MSYKLIFKRVFDIVLSVLFCVVAAPLLVVSIVAIVTSSPGTPFFLQRRVGLHGEIFYIYKLRTMTLNNNRQVKQTRMGDPDVLKVGKLLRRLKIDELPQIFNVLKGDMSLIGPRPCLEITRDAMPQWALTRFDVRPGLTGLAQINGNIELSWEQRWRYDVKYVKSISLILDFKILIKTILVVLFGEDKFKRVS